MAAVSEAMVALQKEFAGKGSERCKARRAGPDTLVVLMGGGCTAAEETLYQSGRANAVRESRRAFQDAMQERMRTTIEGLAGRRVAAFMSATDQDPDLSRSSLSSSLRPAIRSTRLGAEDHALRREP